MESEKIRIALATHVPEKIVAGINFGVFFLSGAMHVDEGESYKVVHHDGTVSNILINIGQKMLDAPGEWCANVSVVGPPEYAIRSRILQGVELRPLAPEYRVLQSEQEENLEAQRMHFLNQIQKLTADSIFPLMHKAKQLDMDVYLTCDTRGQGTLDVRGIRIQQHSYKPETQWKP